MGQAWDVRQAWGTGGPPLAEAFHVERVVDPYTGEAAIGMVRHAGHPWCVPLRGDLHTRSDGAWQALGAAYLADLGAVLQAGLPTSAGAAAVLPWMHPEVQAALQPGRAKPDPGFGWLDVTWDRPVDEGSGRGSGPDNGERRQRLPADCNPLGSFWVGPVGDAVQASGRSLVAGSTLVLLAGTVRGRWMLGSDRGLRLAVHVGETAVRILGITLSGLTDARALHTAPPLSVLKAAPTKLRMALAKSLRANHRLIALKSLERHQRRPGEAPAPKGLLTASGFLLKGRRTNVHVTASPAAELSSETRMRAHEFLVDVLHGKRYPDEFHVVRIRRNVFVGSGMQAREGEGINIFVRDPASDTRQATEAMRSPCADLARLNRFRRTVALPLRSGGLLCSQEEPTLFETRGARPDGDPHAATVTLAHAVVTTQATVPLPASGEYVKGGRLESLAPGAALPAAMADEPRLMSDEQASVECHARATELFLRFKAFGIDPHAYFRFARLPLVQRARPSMLWAPDGELPNAEVRPFMGDAVAGDDDVDLSSGARMQLLVKYGSASPMHRRKLPLKPREGQPPPAPGRLAAQYLSVASDARWAWHEFGHVLNFASTGELEFPFAHSAGDALGAINADPLSRLAEDPEGERRFVTYPWIEVPGRSHGRSPLRGYCWCGRRNQVRLDFRAPLERYQHSYFGEQLMSSSLFRLYRSLGGDTRGAKGDDERRLEAADYCTYLVMRAISLLGPDSIAPARTPDQFVSALIDADLATGAWAVDAEWPLDLEQSPRRMRRQGGRVHKVVRWAFERQGLYGTDDPLACAEGPGMPPDVDVYVADRRTLPGPGSYPPAGPDHVPGGYAPVALRWENGDAPWHADPEALALAQDGRRLRVRLAQRGRLTARGVRVHAWWGAAQEATRQVTWLRSATAPTADVAPGRVTDAWLDVPEDLPPEARWVLVAVDATADPSNLPNGSNLSNLSQAQPGAAASAAPPSRCDEIVELVALDNNLALARIAALGRAG